MRAIADRPRPINPVLVGDRLSASALFFSSTFLAIRQNGRFFVGTSPYHRSRKHSTGRRQPRREAGRRYGRRTDGAGGGHRGRGAPRAPAGGRGARRGPPDAGGAGWPDRRPHVPAPPHSAGAAPAWGASRPRRGGPHEPAGGGAGT